MRITLPRAIAAACVPAAIVAGIATAIPAHADPAPPAPPAVAYVIPATTVYADGSYRVDACPAYSTVGETDGGTYCLPD